MNLIRCWGGAVVPPEAFHDACDELGLMVWQDFPLGCNRYEGTPEYLAVLDQESRSIIRRLRTHPSLAVWCGGNELFNAWSGMTDQDLAIRLLNRNCYDLDPERPFLPTAPVAGMAHGHYVFRDRRGDEVFQIIARASATAYTEFGCPAPADAEVLRETLPEEELFPPRPGTSWETPPRLRGLGPQQPPAPGRHRGLLRPERDPGAARRARAAPPGRGPEVPLRGGAAAEAPGVDGPQLVLLRALARRREPEPRRVAGPTEAGPRRGGAVVPPGPRQRAPRPLHLERGRRVRARAVAPQRHRRGARRPGGSRRSSSSTDGTSASCAGTTRWCRPTGTSPVPRRATSFPGLRRSHDPAAPLSGSDPGARSTCSSTGRGPPSVPEP